MKKQFFISILILVITTTIICLGWTPATCLQPDSYFYEGAAQNLLKGNGYSVISRTTGELTPFTHYPPLTSCAVALIMFITGCSSYFAFRLISIITFSAISILVFNSITNGKKENIIWGILGSLCLIFSRPLIHVFFLEQSEPIFLLLIILNALCIDKYIKAPSFKYIFLLGLITSLAFLARYSGVYLVISNSLILILNKSETIKKRIFNILQYGFIFSITFFSWFIRNFYVSGELHDHHMEEGLLDRIILGIREITLIILPGSIPPILRYPAFIAFFLICFYFIYLCKKSNSTSNTNTKQQTLATILYTQSFIYLLFQIIMCFIILTRLHTRTLSPFYLCLFFAIFMSISQYCSDAINKKIKYAFIIIISLFVAFSFLRASEIIYENIQKNNSSLNQIDKNEQL